MNKLKYICLIFSIVCLVASIKSAYSIVQKDSTNPVLIYAKTGYLSLKGVVFALTSIGLFRKHKVAWKYGWIGFILIFSDFAISSLSRSIALPNKDRYYASVSIAVVTLIAIAVFGLWWKKERSYFVYPTTKN